MNPRDTSAGVRHCSALIRLLSRHVPFVGFFRFSAHDASRRPGAHQISRAGARTSSTNRFFRLNSDDVDRVISGRNLERQGRERHGGQGVPCVILWESHFWSPRPLLLHGSLCEELPESFPPQSMRTLLQNAARLVCPGPCLKQVPSLQVDRRGLTPHVQSLRPVEGTWPWFRPRNGMSMADSRFPMETNSAVLVVGPTEVVREGATGSSSTDHIWMMLGHGG